MESIRNNSGLPTLTLKQKTKTRKTKGLCKNIKDVIFVPRQRNLLPRKPSENLFNVFCELFLFLHFWLHKCSVYPTLGEIWILVKQPKSLTKPNERISRKVNVVTLGSSMSRLPNSGHNRNFPIKLKKKTKEPIMTVLETNGQRDGQSWIQILWSQNIHSLKALILHLLCQ